MFCVGCGVRNPEDAAFCRKCGRKMVDDAAMASDTPPQQASADAVPRAAPDIEALLVQAREKMDTGDTPGAVASCASAIEAHPRSTDALSLMSTLYERTGEIDKAIEMRERVLALNPGSIADREKLEALRTGTQLTPVKIVTSQRSTRLFDSPAGAAVAGIAVMLIVCVIGAAIVFWRTAKSTPVPRQTAAASSSPFMPGGASQGTWSGWQPQPPTGQPAAPTVTQPQPQQQPGQIFAPPTGMAPATGGAGLPLAPVSAPPGARLEDDPRFGARPQRNTDNGTAFLPDPARTAAASPSPTAAQPSPAVRPQEGPGTIEIVVSPDGLSGRGPDGSQPGRAAVAPAAGMDSRARFAMAQQLQLQGDYARAARAYEQSLDGGAADVGRVHQQIAMCYQRLKDNGKADSHYREAIKAYRDQLTAGKQSDAAQQGLRACEAGLQALRQ